MLDLRGNRLKSMNYIKALPELTELYLAENFITHFVGLEEVQALKTVHLRKNPIKVIDEEAMPELPDLEYLNFRETEISSLE